MCKKCERPWLSVRSSSKYANRHVHSSGRRLQIQDGRGYNPYWDNPMKKLQRGVDYTEKEDSRRYKFDIRDFRVSANSQWSLH